MGCLPVWESLRGSPRKWERLPAEHCWLLQCDSSSMPTQGLRVTQCNPRGLPVWASEWHSGIEWACKMIHCLLIQSLSWQLWVSYWKSSLALHWGLFQPVNWHWERITLEESTAVRWKPPPAPEVPSVRPNLEENPFGSLSSAIGTCRRPPPTHTQDGHSKAPSCRGL